MLVSVIIPAYNAAPFIQGAIESALAQTGVAVEVIVVDDGSVDETPAKLAAFGNRIRVVRQANAGIGHARNRGARLARGPWLAFLDADDEWLPEKLVRQLERIGTAELGYTDRRNIGACEGLPERLSQSMPLYQGQVFEELLLGNCLTISSVIIQRQRFETLGGFDPAMRGNEDWDLYLRHCASGGTISLCAEPLTRYRIHGQSLSRNARLMQDGRLRVLRQALQSPRGRLVPRSVARRALARTWTWAAWEAVRSDRSLALAWYLRALACWPAEPEAFRGLARCCLGRL